VFLKENKIERFGVKKGVEARCRLQGKTLTVNVPGTNHWTEWVEHFKLFRMVRVNGKLKLRSTKSTIKGQLKCQRSWYIPALKILRWIESVENEIAVLIIVGESWGGVTAAIVEQKYKGVTYCYCYDSPRPFNKPVSNATHYVNKFSIVNRLPPWRPFLGRKIKTGKLYLNPFKNHWTFDKVFWL
jgi:hypothetical protein